MLPSASAPLRGRVYIARKLLQKSAERYGAPRRDSGVARVATGARFAHFSSADDSEDGDIRYRPFRPISIVSDPSSPPSSPSVLLRRTLAIASLGPAPSYCELLPIGTPAQLRCLSSSPSRSSTTAAHPAGSFSSKAPADGGHDDQDEMQSRYESAREKGREVAKRGRAAANTGAKAAKKGALSMRDMVQKYGWTFLGTYFSLYFTTVGAIFAGIDSGLLDPASVLSAASWMHGGTEAGDAAEAKSTVEILSHMLERWEWTKPYAKSVTNNPHATNLGIAWIATKFTEPIRLMLTFAIVPRVHRLLGGGEEDGTNTSEEEHRGEKKE